MSGQLLALSVVFIVMRLSESKALLESVCAIAQVWISPLRHQVLQYPDCFGYSIDLHEAFIILLLWTYCSRVAGVVSMVLAVIISISAS